MTKKTRKDPQFVRPHLLTTIQERIYDEQRLRLHDIKSRIENLNYEEKLRLMSEKMDFVRSFTTKGVQGVVGFVSFKSPKESETRAFKSPKESVEKEIPNYSSNPVVFKLSTDINMSVEHEYEIMEYFNDMRRYCPHFSRSIGMIELPVSTDFLTDSLERSLFEFDEETIPRNVLFMEYVNKLPFYRLCQDCEDKNIIISQILQVMIALEIGQRKKKLTHYDLHTANILIQMCEPDSLFIYKIGGKNYICPTYGFFPLLIDMGISYSDISNGKKMKSNTDNYDHGFQTTEFDRLNDVHHFLLTSLYYIEVDSDMYDHLSNKIKFIFRHLPVLRKSGWKQLPNDLCDLLIETLKDQCESYKNYLLFDEYSKQSVELFNNLITLPIKKRNTGEVDFSMCFTTFMEEYHKMINIDDFSEHDVLFVLREIISAINCSKESGTESFKCRIYSRLSTVIKTNVSYDGVDYERLLLSGIVFGENLETFYEQFISEHKEIINEKYSKTTVDSPIDLMVYISKNCTPHFNVSNKTIVYIWDTDLEENNVCTCDKISKRNIDRINRAKYSDKAELLLKYIK